MNTFKAATPDSDIKTWTGVFVAILVFVGGYFSWETLHQPSLQKAIPSIFPFVILILAYLYRPFRYILEEEQLILVQGLKKTSIALSDIQSIEQLITVKPLQAGGSGKVFGYIGEVDGDEVWCATNKHKILRIKTRTMSYYISPENSEEFKIELKKLLKP